MYDPNEWPAFLMVKEVAAILRVANMTVYRLVHSGELHSIKASGRSIRIPSESLVDYLESKGL